MAFENLNGMTPFSVDATTGLLQYQAVAIGANGAVAPTDGAAIGGVIRSSGTTASTSTGGVVALYVNGMVAKVLAAGSTMAVGDQCSVSTAGRVTALAAGDYAIGHVVGGSSGSTDRVLSVLLAPIGTT